MDQRTLSLGLDRRRFLLALSAAGGILARRSFLRASTPFQGSELPAGARAGEWPLTGCNLRGTRSNEHERTIGPGNVGRLKVKWTFEGAGNFNQTTPVVVGNSLYFAAHDGFVYALDTTSGGLKWKFNAWEGIVPNPPGTRRVEINIDPLGGDAEWRRLRGGTDIRWSRHGQTALPGRYLGEGALADPDRPALRNQQDPNPLRSPCLWGKGFCWNFQFSGSRSSRLFGCANGGSEMALRYRA